MTRWHEWNCLSPDVHVGDANIPVCRACLRRCPSVTTLKAIANNASSGIALPPDEPRGQMNLWWPRDVLYVNRKPLKETHTVYKAYKPGFMSPGEKVKEDIENFAI